MKGTTAYAIMWIMTSIAIIIGLFVTKNANCLWGFYIPALFVNGITDNENEEVK